VTVESLQRENDQLRQALASRVVIEQAKGIVMLRYDLDEGQALALLTRWSQQTNTKLRVIAGAVVDVITHKDVRAQIEHPLAGELNRLLWRGGKTAG
jgi:AmiR/NasT family two-component response regulator